MKTWLAQTLNAPQRLAIPIMTHPGIEHLGKTVKQAVTDGKIHFEAVQALNISYPSAACTTIMDLTVEAEAFGAHVVFSDHEIPSIEGRLLTDEAAINQLTIPNLDQGRIKEYLLANKLAAQHITDKPVLGGCIGPFSLAGRLYDLSELMMLCYTEPDTAKNLLSKCAEFISKYCQALKEQGIGGIVIAEPAAGLLSAEGCQEFSSDYIKTIVDAIQDDYFMVILHNCGNKGHCTDAMLATGAQGYHFGNMMNMVLALEQCPPEVLVMGNLDPVSLFKKATAEEMKASTLTLLNQTAAHKNFILSSGCDVPPAIPESNIIAFYEALAQFNKNKNE